jgi:predicted RNase H-like HicB family nuclease
MRLQRTIQASVRWGDTHYVAECLEVPVVTQGETLDITLANLREAVALHLEGEDTDALGIVADPAIVVTMELEPVNA